VEAPRRREHRLAFAEPPGKLVEPLARHGERRGDREPPPGDRLLDRQAAADAARRGRHGLAAELARALEGVRGKSRDDGVLLLLRGEPRLFRPGDREEVLAALDHALPVEEPRGELLVVPGSAHRRRKHSGAGFPGAANPDEERLLDGESVLALVLAVLFVSPDAFAVDGFQREYGRPESGLP